MKNINFTTIRLLFFERFIGKVLVSKKIYFCEKIYQYFIDYLYNGNKVKLLHTMLPGKSSYVNSYDEQNNWMYFLIENNSLIRKI